MGVAEMNKTIVCSLLVAFLAGCANVREETLTNKTIKFEETSAEEILKFHKKCECVVADLKVRIRMRGNGNASFDASILVNELGRTRVAITKLDHAVLDAIIDLDGSYKAINWDEKWISTGLLSSLFGAGKANPRLLVNELTQGPLYKTIEYSFQRGPLLGGLDPATGCVFILKFDGMKAVNKTYYFTNPLEEALVVTYSGYEDRQGYLRPLKAIISGKFLSEIKDVTIGVRYFNAIPVMPESKFTLREHESFNEFGVEELRKRLSALFAASGE
jgi:hypothetical protein